jgi:hypothetical protein
VISFLNLLYEMRGYDKFWGVGWPRAFWLQSSCLTHGFFFEGVLTLASYAGPGHEWDQAAFAWNVVLSPVPKVLMHSSQDGVCLRDHCRPYYEVLENKAGRNNETFVWLGAENYMNHAWLFELMTGAVGDDYYRADLFAWAWSHLKFS